MSPLTIRKIPDFGPVLDLNEPFNKKVTNLIIVQNSHTTYFKISAKYRKKVSVGTYFRISRIVIFPYFVNQFFPGDWHHRTTLPLFLETISIANTSDNGRLILIAC